MNTEILYTLALQRAIPFYPAAQTQLIQAAGSAAQLYAQRHALADIAPHVPQRVLHAAAQMHEHLATAEREIAFMQQHHIRPLLHAAPDYPTRLRDLRDAPAVLFALGSADLVAPRILSIVGSRNCTEQGRRYLQHFLTELKSLCPDVLIVSGLAYGIDIAAHRGALNCQLPTVGVLAHGLDQIYPQAHTQTARQMLAQRGGLLTEYPRGVPVDKSHFVARNRIVAALSAATLVVESKAWGGSLITTRIAGELQRPVFAVPGRVDDPLSVGCNQLIARGKAQLLLSAADLVQHLGWMAPAAPLPTVQPAAAPAVPHLSPLQQQLYQHLQGVRDGLTPNDLTLLCGAPFAQVSATLFELEMQGMIKMISGGRYTRA